MVVAAVGGDEGGLTIPHPTNSGMADVITKEFAGSSRSVAPRDPDSISSDIKNTGALDLLLRRVATTTCEQPRQWLKQKSSTMSLYGRKHKYLINCEKNFGFR